MCRCTYEEINNVLSFTRLMFFCFNKLYVLEIRNLLMNHVCKVVVLDLIEIKSRCNDMFGG